MIRSNTWCALFVLLSSLSSAAWSFQVPPGPPISIQISGGPHFVIKSPTVHRLLQLDEKEVAFAMELAEKCDKESKAMIHQELQAMLATNGQRIQVAELQARIEQLKSDRAENFYEDLGQKLTPKQVERLKGIELQLAGIQAFERSETREAIGFTKDQLEDVDLTIAEYKSDVSSLRTGMGLNGPAISTTAAVVSSGTAAPAASSTVVPPSSSVDPKKSEEFNAKQRELQAKKVQAIIALMTEKQRSTFEKMRGEVVDLDGIREEMKATFSKKP